MKVLIACEFSGIVRDAFKERGHDAWSCDLLETETPGQHIKGNIMEVLYDLDDYYDLMIAFPPCTHLAVSGAKWFKHKQEEQDEAIKFVYNLLNADVEKIALENPIGIISSRIRKPDQIIQPWQFGHGETKATCLWLKNLPKLQHFAEVDLFNTEITHVKGRVARVHKEPPGPNRWKNRSRTLTGIAKAMAEQWG